MRKADYRKQGFLNEKCIQLIFQKKKKLFIDLLKIQDVESFFDVFDVDKVRVVCFSICKFVIKRKLYLGKIKAFNNFIPLVFYK